MKYTYILCKDATVRDLVINHLQSAGQAAGVHRSAFPKRGPSIRGSRFVPVAGGGQRLLDIWGISELAAVVVIYLC